MFDKKRRLLRFLLPRFWSIFCSIFYIATHIHASFYFSNHFAEKFSFKSDCPEVLKTLSCFNTFSDLILSVQRPYLSLALALSPSTLAVYTPLSQALERPHCEAWRGHWHRCQRCCIHEQQTRTKYLKRKIKTVTTTNWQRTNERTVFVLLQQQLSIQFFLSLWRNFSSYSTKNAKPNFFVS